MPPVTAPQPSLLDRALRIFADVRAGEGLTALILFANSFLLLCGYYFLKAVREGLIIAYGGKELKSYSSAFQAVLLIGATYAFAALARRFVRFKLIAVVNVFFVVNLAIFFGLDLMRVPVSVPFFIWVGIYNLTVISSFYAFANDLYTKEQGERLFPLVVAGATIGGALGALVISQFAEELGSSIPMLLGAGILLLATACTWLAHRRGSRAEGAVEVEPPAGPAAGFGLIKRDRYLLLVAIMMLVINWANTSGEFILDGLIEEQVATEVGTAPAAGESQAAFEERGEAWVSAYRAKFFLWVNLVAMFLQLFVVSRVVKYLGVRTALFVLPVIALGGHAAMAIVPALMVVTLAKVGENSANYSMQNTANQTLWLVTDREQKYKAKNTIDTFFWRFGDVASAGVTLLGTALSFAIHHFIYLNMALQVVWILIVIAVVRRHREKASRHGESESPVPAAPAAPGPTKKPAPA